MKNLAIYEILENLKASFKTTNKLILQAPPGSGKSTVIPTSLLGEDYISDKKIIVLQPRRVATRMVASRLAFNLDEKVGNTVGYIIKNESVQSKNTKVLIVTEAILVRMLQDDQELSSVAMVIFDEFHERSIHTDLSLALCLQVQELLRDDLKLLVMSATLNSEDTLKVLGKDTNVITSDGALFELENIYLSPKIFLNKNNIYSITLDVILNAIKNDAGDILVFLSGIKYINLLQKQLRAKVNLDEIIILPLHSQLQKKEQDLAINKNVKRKIILSTNIAQTSVTIDGLKVVIDTGYEKQSSYNHNTSMNALNEQFISIDSSVQRAGRAGRTSKGKCYKIWHQNKILEQNDKPEILRSDLKPLLLDLALWGEDDFSNLAFIDIPKEDFIAQNKLMLKQLNMINDDGSITANASRAIKLGLHPRYAYMILKANDLGFAYEACIMAAILSSNIFNIHLKDYFIDIYEKNIRDFNQREISKSANIYFDKLKKLKDLSIKSKKFDIKLLGVLVLFAYPDRLAKQRKKDSELYKLSNGKGAALKKNDILFNQRYLVVPSLNALNTNSIINMALSIELDFIKTYFKNDIQNKIQTSYDKKTNQITTQEIFYIMNLELYSTNLSLDAIPNKLEIFLDLINQEGLELLTWDSKALLLQERTNFINHNSNTKVKDLSNEYLKNNTKEWLEPYMQDISSIKELQGLNIYTILYSTLNWQEQKELESLAPTHIQVPSGSNIKIDYKNKEKPLLKVKLQEIFTLFETPKILNNTIALQVHILSPGLKQVAITYDLKSFWDNSYTDVVKDLKGKYKRHYWPPNPYEAIATVKTKKHLMKE